MNIADILHRFEGVKQCNAHQWQAKCPAHDDHVASLCIGVGDDSRVLVKCQAGCATGDVLGRVGLEMRHLFGNNGEHNKPSTLGRIVAEYNYCDAAGNLLYQVVRFEPKAFRQRVRALNGGWKWITQDVPKVPYRLPELLAADPAQWAFVVEGERDCESVRALGLTSTTNAGGAGKWKLAYAEHLRDRRCCIITDADEPGRRHAEQVARSLSGVAADVRVVEMPGGAKDASDYIAARDSCDAAELAQQFIALAEAAPRWEPTDETETARVEVASDEHYSDLGNARRLVRLYGGNLHYCHPCAKWLSWDDRRWLADDTGEVYRLAKDAVREMHRQAASESDDEVRKAAARHALASESDHRIKAMVELAKTEPGIPVVPRDFDADVWLLNCANGTLDLRTGELREHRRADLITKLVPAAFHEDAEHEVWTRFLNDATGGDAEVAAFLQRAIGYSLTGDTCEEKLFFVHGPTAAGKSTFIEAVKAALGEYATTADFETFLERSHVGGPRADVARLEGARFVASVEVSEGKHLAAGLVKLLTGGDTVAARHLYKEAFEFAPRFKLWLAANHAPRVDDTDDALWRRMVRVPFERVVPEGSRDPKVKATLRNDPSAQAAVLAWAVQGCLAWQREGLRVPRSVAAATAAYRMDQDPLAEFFAELCTFGAEHEIETAKLRSAYLTYAEVVGIRRPLSPRAFADRLKDRGCEPDKVAGRRIWKGIEVLHDNA